MVNRSRVWSIQHWMDPEVIAQLARIHQFAFPLIDGVGHPGTADVET